LLSGGDALERGYNVNTVIFDKTGTLTLGRPQVMEAAVFCKHYTLQQVRACTDKGPQHLCSACMAHGDVSLTGKKAQGHVPL
jgi:cation transport ATPase